MYVMGVSRHAARLATPAALALVLALATSTSPTGRSDAAGEGERGSAASRAVTLDVEVPQAPASVTKIDGSQTPTAPAPGGAVAAEALPPALHIATTTALGHQVADAGIAHVLLDAYRSAAGRVPSSCQLPVSLLAAIGEVESGSLVGRSIDAHHRTFVLGPVLNGNGFAAIADTDNGRLDGDSRWDRAMGPMQFVPSTWKTFGVDGDGDGVADPQNIYDAAASAAGYLCYGGRDLSQPAMLSAAILSYNHSSAYERLVLTYQQRYAGLGLDEGGLSALPAAVVSSGSTTVATFAPGLQPTAAPRPGGHRSHAARTAASKGSHHKGLKGHKGKHRKGHKGSRNGGPSPTGPTVSPAGTPAGPTSPTENPTTPDPTGPTETPTTPDPTEPTETPTTPDPTGPTETPTTPDPTEPTDTPTTPEPTDTPTTPDPAPPTETPTTPAPTACTPPEGADPTTCPPCDPAAPSGPTDPAATACTPAAIGQKSPVTTPSTTSSP
jgi:Transglycosylase SLT domain